MGSAGSSGENSLKAFSETSCFALGNVWRLPGETLMRQRDLFATEGLLFPNCSRITVLAAVSSEASASHGSAPGKSDAEPPEV